MPNTEDHKGLFSDRHIVGAFAIGVVLILLGFLMDEYLRGIFVALGTAWRHATGVAEPAATVAAETHHLDLVGLSVLLVKELGVAFLVAGIIGVAVERQAKERDNRRAMQLRTDVASDAIFAIYGLRHRPEFVKAVVETNLEQKIVRENMVLRYLLRTVTEDEAKTILPHRHLDALERFVILEMESTYTFRNVSASQQEVDVRYAIPLRQGPGARQLTKANYVRIGNRDLKGSEVDDAIVDQTGDELLYSWRRRLDPDETLPVIISSLCVKERSDNEVWGSFFPSVGGVTLTLSVLDGMRFGIRPLSSAKMMLQPSVPSETSRTWKLEGPLLKHNSAVFWWRTPEDDAEEDEKSPPVEFSQTDQIPHKEAVANEEESWKRFIPFRRRSSQPLT